MSALPLRPYQSAAIDSVQAAREAGLRRGLLVAATGTGKTRMFSELVKIEAENGGCSLILAHIEELIDQGVERLKGDNPHLKIAKEQASCRASQWLAPDAIVASVQTIGKSGTDRLRWFKPTLIITDESHHAAADTYMNVYRSFGVFDESGPFHLGVTATPHRLDNKPLHGTESAIFQDVVFKYDIKDAIFDGYLCDVRGYRVRAGWSLQGVKKTAGDYNQKQLSERVDTDGENLQAFKHWREVASDRQTVVFCIDIDHAERMAKVFNAFDVDARSVSGKTPKEERRRLMQDFRDGRFQVLTNCMVATEGFDAPRIGCVLLLRPTQSWSLYVQMVGRGLRTAEGKADCIVIDVVGMTDEKSLVELPEVIGLPRTFETKGGSLKEMVEKWDDLQDWQKQKLLLRKFNLDSIDSVLRETDLLAELKPPEEVVGSSSYNWMPFSSDSYILACGDSRSGLFLKRAAYLMADTLGRYSLKLTHEHGVCLEEAGIDLALDEAFKHADRQIDKVWPDARYLVDREAAWRKRTNLSDKQRHFLGKAGYSPDQIAQMTMGEASNALDKYFRNKKAVAR